MDLANGVHCAYAVIGMFQNCLEYNPRESIPLSSRTEKGFWLSKDFGFSVALSFLSLYKLGLDGVQTYQFQL